jgi:hemin uptake protein HemP
MIVCICHRVSDRDIARAAREGCARFDELQFELAADGSARRWLSTELFGTAQVIEIEHGPAVYRLRRTALGKLILTK